MQIKVGFLGVGAMGQHHLKTVHGFLEAKVVAVCDVDAELSRAMGTQYDARHYTNHHEMLDKEELDALYVVVPPFAHTDAELIAARKGIHLFVEKPVALTMEKAREVQAAVRKAGIITSVGYTLRYFEAPTRLQQFLRDETIAMIVITRWGGLPGTPWWRVMSRSGGQLVEQTTHQVDLVRYITGREITNVYADYATRVLGDEPGLDIPDVQSVAMRLDDGTPVSLTTSCNMREGGGDSSMNFLMKDYLLATTPTKIRTSPHANPELDGEFGEQMNIDRAFIEAIRHHDPSYIRCDYTEGLKSLAVTLAANESAATGRPVKVSLD